MLTHIHIRDFAIIDAVELECGAGMTVLTGETGAGKSILVDALLVAAGGRAGAEVVRHGAERAEVAATFEIGQNAAAIAWLTEQAIDHEGECLLRRVVSVDGRSRAYVNGVSVSVQALRQLGESLIDVHGQMEYQTLVKRGAQRALLDASAGHDALVEQTAAHWQTWSELKAQREAAAASAHDRDARLEMLRYHLNELRALDLKEGEVQALAAERQRLAQGGKLATGAAQIAHLLREAEDVNAEQSLARALALARPLAELDTRLQNAVALLDDSLIALRESADAIERYQQALDADPDRQEWVEQRLAAIEAIARKHRVNADALLESRRTFEKELEQLETLEASLDEIDKRLAQARELFQQCCEKLSKARSTAAAELSSRITTLMQTLGMPGGLFQIEVRALELEAAGPHGADDIEFLVSANPGQPPKPLARVASGGELSRISLAIQVAAVQRNSASCLVFDEVDAGVGGGVAEIVGRQLRALGEHAQVLCVTHLPQVASQAHAQVRVAKFTDGKTTRTALHALTPDERIEEIARMLGGIDITDKAREHAAEMLGASAPRAKKKAARK